MIGFLRGRVFEKSEESLVLDVGGVGYELFCSLNTLTDVLVSEGESRESREVQLWVQTFLREDALTLFGFSTVVEKRMFQSLIKVNGVGPKMAIKILSGASLDQLSSMIEAGDVKALSTLPKVGKKTAEQMILSLKGKLVLMPQQGEPKSAKKSNSAQVPPRFTGVRSEILSALVNLGFRLQDAERVVEDLPNDVDLQQGLRKGLQALSGSF